MNNENFNGFMDPNETRDAIKKALEMLRARQVELKQTDPEDEVVKAMIDPDFVKVFKPVKIDNENLFSKILSEKEYDKFKEELDRLSTKGKAWIDFGRYLDTGKIDVINNIDEAENIIYNSDAIAGIGTTDKKVVHLFTSNGQSDLSNQTSGLKAKAKANVLGVNKSRFEVIDLTGCEIKNTLPDGDENKLTYMSFDYNPDSNYDFIASTAGILELEYKGSRIGLVMMAYSYEDNLDGLSDYLEDSLMEIYNTGYNDWKIINFHIATEGFSPDKDFATVLAGIAF